MLQLFLCILWGVLSPAEIINEGRLHRLRTLANRQGSAQNGYGHRRLHGYSSGSTGAASGGNVYVNCPPGTWDTGFSSATQACMSGQYVKPGDSSWPKSKGATHWCCVMKGYASAPMPPASAPTPYTPSSGGGATYIQCPSGSWDTGNMQATAACQSGQYLKPGDSGWSGSQAATHWCCVVAAGGSSSYATTVAPSTYTTSAPSPYGQSGSSQTTAPPTYGQQTGGQTGAGSEGATTAAPTYGQQTGSETTAPTYGQTGAGSEATTAAPTYSGSETTAAPSYGQTGSGSETTAAPSCETTAAPSYGQAGSGSETTAAPSYGQTGSGSETTAAPSYGQTGSGSETTAAPSYGQTTCAPSSGGNGNTYVPCPSNSWDTGSASSTAACSSGHYLKPGDSAWPNSEGANHWCCCVETYPSAPTTQAPESTTCAPTQGPTQAPYSPCPAGSWDTGSMGATAACMSGHYLKPGDSGWSNSEGANHWCCCVETYPSPPATTQAPESTTCAPSSGATYVQCPTGSWDTGSMSATAACMSGQYLKPGDSGWSGSEGASHWCCVTETAPSAPTYGQTGAPETTACPSSGSGSGTSNSGYGATTEAPTYNSGSGSSGSETAAPTYSGTGGSGSETQAPSTPYAGGSN